MASETEPKRFLVVALTHDGEELQRVTVGADKLDEAKRVFEDFADWVDVVEVPSSGGRGRAR